MWGSKQGWARHMQKKCISHQLCPSLHALLMCAIISCALLASLSGDVLPLSASLRKLQLRLLLQVLGGATSKGVESVSMERCHALLQDRNGSHLMEVRSPCIDTGDCTGRLLCCVCGAGCHCRGLLLLAAWSSAVYVAARALSSRAA